MNNNKIIVMPMYSRAKYSKAVLDALNECRGVEEYLVLIHLDGPMGAYDEVYAAAEAFRVNSRARGVEIVREPTNIGCNANILKTLCHGFDLSDFVIILEDDVKPAPDCLLYLEWGCETFQDQPRIVSICGYNNLCKADINPEWCYVAYRRNHFTPWGWGTWIDRWEKILKPAWPRIKLDGGGKPEAWDTCVSRETLGGHFEIYPHLARTQNIGAEDGTYVPSPQWHAQNQYNENWAAQYDLRGGKSAFEFRKQ